MIAAMMRTQLRLILRNWAFWAVSAGSILMAVEAVSHVNMAAFNNAITESSFRFFLLGAMLVSIAQAARERGERVQELIEALPYRPLAWVVGRFLPVFGLWLLMSTVIWGVGLATMAGLGRPISIGMAAWNWLIVAPVSTGFATALGLALGQTRIPEILSYLLAAGVWIGMVSLAMLFTDPRSFSAAFLDMLPAERFFPFTAQGYFLQLPLVLLNRLFLLSLAGAILAWSLYRLGERRHLRQTAAAVLVVLLAAGTVLSAVAFGGVLSGREDAYAAETKKLVRGPVAAAPQGPLAADDYEIELSLHPEQHRADARATFALTNTGPSPLAVLELTLRSNFEVQTLETADGRPLAYQRSHDGLTVEHPLAPAESIRLQVTYGGEVWQWVRPFGSREPVALAAHIAPDSVFLPGGYGWYPLPNRHSLRRLAGFCTSEDPGSCRDEVDEAYTYHPPASMQVTVTGTGLKLVTNAGSGVTGLYLVGTPFDTVEVDGVLVTVDPTNRPGAERLAEAVAERVRFLNTVLSRTSPGPIRLIELHGAMALGLSYMPEPDAAPGAILLHSNQFSWGDPSHYLDEHESLVTSLWWPASRAWQSRSLVEGMAQYMAGLRTGPVDKAPQARPSTSSLFEGVLIQVEKAKGRETTVQLLQRFHSQMAQGGPDLKQFRAAVQEAAGDVPAVNEALTRALQPFGGK